MELTCQRAQVLLLRGQIGPAISWGPPRPVIIVDMVCFEDWPRLRVRLVGQ